ncbi:hypothetical protein N7489_007637 [Penicillium chrysogenum]|uniref:uncharacterized protein n=1 Tax=Penicillium chrysogenum TaxID=5076 RepID=UPI00238E8B06|nr:uncharacterized protein N7489_007637 [Penicillium chrysogenum]KAJ5237546.1 hypothetical protein N7489_007637 [Penicillium chrysogenum]KAJ5277848.1 hypothetical protein N7524_004001 [Penicillium chrysogenum]
MTPRYEVPRALSFCPHCANILAIAKIDTEIKVICRTCPYTCSIGDIAPPVPDSDDENNKVDGNKVDRNKVDSEKVDSNKVGSKKVDGNKVDGNKVDGNKVDDTNVSS